jgi:hypothetical protein
MDPYSQLYPLCDFKSRSSRPTLCSSTIYIYYTLLKFCLILFPLLFGLLAGHISSVLTLMLTVSFVDGSP